MTFLVVNTAATRRELDNDLFTVSGIMQKYNCLLKRLDFQQEQGLVSSLPLGYNGIEIQRGMTTSSTAIFVPFMTQELRMDGEAIYYGLNALSHNVIMANRKKLKNPNGLYLGVPGSGKSFSGKRELVNVFLATNDRIIILDPMGEYSPLVRQFGKDGLVVEIAPNSPHFINPMDLDLSMDDEVSPISLKCDFILSLMELIVGGKDGLQPVERTIIDRCARMVYRDLLNDPEHAPMPTLQDLYDLLCQQSEPEAKRLATALEIYVSGSLNLFNHKTNVDYKNARVLCFDLKKLGSGLRKIAMHILNDLSNNQVSYNFSRGIATWCYYDEFHVLLQDELTSSYFVTIWKMLRKKGCVPSALTQNVKDLLASRQIENIFENSDFMVLLSQAQGDRQILAKQLGISPHQLSYVTHSNPGEGLLFFGNVTISFRKLLAGKLIVSAILSFFLGIVCFAFTVVANFIMGYDGFALIPALTGLVQMALLGFFLYLTMLPIIVLTSRHKGSFLVGVIVAFVYGFIGMFANGTLQSIYPVSAALGLINYRAGAEGVMWNKGLCFISILIMCAIGIALMFVKQKPEKRESKKTQHTAPKKGW